MRVRGEQKDTFTIWFHLQQRTLHYETYVMPAPEENHAAFFEHLLRRNRKLYGAAFAIGEEDAVFLVGQLDNAADHRRRARPRPRLALRLGRAVLPPRPPHRLRLPLLGLIDGRRSIASRPLSAYRPGTRSGASSAGPLGEEVTTVKPPPLPLIFSITVTGILANTLVGPAIPDILDAFDQPDSRAGVFVAAGTLPGIVMAPVIGVLADRFGRRAVLVPCLVGFGVFGLLSALAPTFPALLAAPAAARGSARPGSSTSRSSSSATTGPGLERARLVGQNAAILTISLAVFPPLGGLLTELGGWRLSFAALRARAWRPPCSSTTASTPTGPPAASPSGPSCAAPAPRSGTAR